ncbi:MAG: septum site-determining protein MinC [Lachnospiraceae bacterium]|nr:septum site-determining protein MinC [Lachnospiraceae bacterium]
MKNSVVIKGNKYGIMVILDKDIPFEELISDIIEKFKESSKFFGSASMAISFEGRKLTTDEERRILDIISEYSEIDVICVVDNDKKREEMFKEKVEQKVTDISSASGQFYRGTLRSGQVLECESSVVILGDVNPGAKIISTGNVVVLGALKGIVYAGITGDASSFVVALEMNPVQIRIGDVIARCSDNKSILKKKKNKPETKIAFVEDDNIYIEPLNKDVLSDLQF